MFPCGCIVHARARMSACALARHRGHACRSPRAQVKLSMPAVEIMQAFQARDILFELCIAQPQEQDDPGTGTSARASPSIVNAFSLMREGSRRMVEGSSRTSTASQPLPPPSYNLSNAKIQLEMDVHEVLCSLGLESPPSQHEFLRKALKIIVNFFWFIDPYHEVLRRRKGQLPRPFEHLAENSYNNYREKKQKAPPFQTAILEAHTNELFSLLAIPTLKLPANVRVLDALNDLACMAALQVAQMKKHAAGMRTRRENMILNDGKIAISFMGKKIGPFHQEVEKELIRKFRDLVRIMPPSSATTCSYA